MSVLDLLGRGGGRVFAGGVGGGVLGYLSDGEAPAQERYARALAGALLGGVAGGAMKSAPRLAKDFVLPEPALWHAPQNVVEVLKGGEARRLMPDPVRRSMLRASEDYLKRWNAWEPGLKSWKSELGGILADHGLDATALEPRASAPGQARGYHGSAWPLRDVEPGLFVTNDFHGAERYATRDAARTGAYGRITPIDLNMRNPLVFDGDGAMLSSVLQGRSIEEAARAATAQGHDGVLFRNVVDVPGDPRSAAAMDVYYVTEPGTATPRRAYFPHGGGEIADFFRRIGRRQ